MNIYVVLEQVLKCFCFLVYILYERLGKFGRYVTLLRTLFRYNCEELREKIHILIYYTIH